jgi:hypothetical protein
MRRPFFLLLSTLLVPTAAAGDPVSPSDFAYTAGILTQGEGAVYRLGLTPEVYDGLTRPDLGDLRVFNAAGQPVPHALIMPSAAQAPDLKGSEMDLETAAGPIPGEYLFRIPRGLALDGLRIRLPEVNTLAGASLESRSSETEPWRERLRTTLYRLRQEDVELENPDQDLGGRPDPFWRLRVDRDSGGIGPGLPGLRAIYRPHELRFVARGQGPYTLAWGSARPMSGPASDTDGILRTADIAPLPARIEGQVRRVGDLGVLTPPLPWRTWFLWVVLVGGALLLVWMAVRLFRQMNPRS